MISVIEFIFVWTKIVKKREGKSVSKYICAGMGHIVKGKNNAISIMFVNKDMNAKIEIALTFIQCIILQISQRKK